MRSPKVAPRAPKIETNQGLVEVIPIWARTTVAGEIVKEDVKNIPEIKLPIISVAPIDLRRISIKPLLDKKMAKIMPIKIIIKSFFNSFL